MSVVDAVTEELENLAAASSTFAATALAMARELDDVVAEEECAECGHVQEWTVGHNSATSKSMCAKVLIDTMEKLRTLSPPKETEDEIERARKRRTDRLARQAASGAPSPS